MRNIKRKETFSPALALAAILTFPTMGWAQAVNSDMITMMQTRLGLKLEKLEHDCQESDKEVTGRDISNGALTALLVKSDSRLAKAFLKQIMDAQDMETGVLPWTIQGSKPIKDENSIEFGTQAWGPMLLAYGQALGEPLSHDLARHAHAALKELARHNPPVTYTNIYLMNAVNTLLISEALNDPSALSAAQAKLKAWWEYTKTYGIHEFDSPTYYSCDLNCLTLGYRFANDPNDRAFFKQALDLFWNDIATNTVNGHLIGPHSRDYDFLHGAGGLDIYQMSEGLTPIDTHGDLDLEKIFALLSFMPGGYRPAKHIIDIAHQPERWALTSWGEEPGQLRSIYVSHDAAIGCVSGSDYGPQDKLFTIDLPAHGRSVTISFVPSADDNPYGKPTRDPSGHVKPHHPPLHMVAVQQGGWVLGSLDLDPSQEKHAESFTVSLLIPSNVDELRLGGKVFNGTSISDGQSPTLQVRCGESCAVVRILQADMKAAPQLIQDDFGRTKNVARLVIPQSGSADHARILFLARAGTCGPGGLSQFSKEVGDARVKIDMNESRLRAAVTVEGHRLELRRDIEDRNHFSTAIDDSPVQQASF